MSTNYNVSPFYDDFSADNNYHRILFKPGVAVQARELTQSQTILQNQIGSFGTNIFADGSLVSGGQTHLDDSSFYLIASPTYNGQSIDFSNIIGNTITEMSSGKTGHVKSFSAATSSDGPTLFVNINGQQSPFTDGSTFTVSGKNSAGIDITPYTISSVSANSSGTSLLFHVSKGVYFTNSIFVSCPEQTIIVSKYTKITSSVIGLNIVESTASYFNDASLLDPALGASNYLAPGADRYKIELQLATQLYSETAIAYQSFIRLATVVDGVLINQVSTPIYSTIMDTMAKRTYDTNGDFLVKQFLPTIQDDTQDTSKLILSISAGSAFVKGYEIETIAPTNISISKARDTDTQTSQSIPTSPGNVVYINTLYGSLPTFGSSTNTFTVEIHNVSTGQNSTSLMGTAIILDLEYVSGAGTSAVFGVCLTGISLTKTSFGAARSFIITSVAGVYSSLSFSSIIDSSSITSLQAQIQYPSLSPLLYALPYDYTKSLANVNYYYKKSFTGTVSSNVIAITSSLDTFIPSSGLEILHNYTMVTSGGVFIPLDAATVTISGLTASINLNTAAYNGNSVIVLATLHTTNVTKRSKSLVPNSVGSTMTITGTESHDLMKSDIYSLDGVYEFATTSTYKGVWTSGSAYVSGDIVYISNSAYSCTTTESNSVVSPATNPNWAIISNSVSFYSYNNGQTDSYYDHGSIFRNSIPKSTVNIIPIFSYFTHSGSIGHLSPDSYPTTGTNSIDYANIPKYTSSTGVVYNLNSNLDFRPIRTNDTSSFAFAAFQLPILFTGIPVMADVTYYLGRIDKAILTRDGLFKLLTGVPSYLNPKPPVSQDDSITLFVLSYKPYTSFKTDIDLQLVPHKRYTMKDISDIDDRVSNIEYYTSLSTLESQTNSQVVTNANGTTLFKNGFIVDTFNGHGIGDTLNPEYRASIDYSNGIARPTYVADNVYLTYDNVNSSTTKGVDTTISTLITVPYTSNVFVNQPLASEAISVNPFGVVNFVGTLKLSPESDVWFDTKSAPYVVINPNGSNDNYKNWAGIETQWNAWQDVWTGTQITESTSGTVGKTPGSIVTSQSLTSTTTTSTTSSGTGASSSSSSVVVNKNIIPYARSKTIQFQVDGMSANTNLYLYINNINMATSLYPYGSGANTSILNPGVKTDSSGSANGYIILPNSPTQQLLSGNENIIICDNIFDWTQSISYAQATFFSEGFIKTLNNPIISTKPNSKVTTQLQISGLNNYATSIVPTANVTISVPSGPAAAYSLTADHSMIVSGSTINFVFSTTNAPAGTSYNANISGTVINADLTGYVLGNTTITTVGTSAISQGVISIPISKTAVTGATNKYILLEVDVTPSTGITQKYYSNVSIQTATAPSYSITAPTNVIAGNTASVVFSVNNLLATTTYYYSVASSTTDNGATGSFIISPTSGANTLSFIVPSTYTSVGGGNDLINVNYSWGTGNSNTLSSRTSVSANVGYSLASSASSINAGQTDIITLSSFGIPTGTSIPYTITGLNLSTDINIPLTGNFVTNSSGSNTISFTANSAIGNTETLVFSLNSPRVASVGVRIASVISPPPITISTPMVTANASVITSTPFNFNISGGPAGGNWYAVSDTGEPGIGSVTSKIALLSTGAATYTLSAGQSKVGKCTWVFYFSDGATATVSVLATAPVLLPSYSVSGPSTSSSGQIVSFVITATNQSSIITVPYTISNPALPGGLWLSNAPGTNTTTTLVNSGSTDWVAYVDMNADVTAAYTDALNASNGRATTIYAQQGFTSSSFANAGTEYTFLTSTNCPWVMNAKISKGTFGAYFDSLNPTGSHSKPQISTITGSVSISSATSPQVINILVNNEPVTSLTSTITLNVAGAVNQSKSVIISNTYQPLRPPTLSSASQKIVGNGDFVDSHLTWQQAIATLSSTLTTAQLAEAISTTGPIILGYYRNSASLNRNPDLSGFLYWVGLIYTLSTPTILATPAALASVHTQFITAANSTGAPAWTTGIGGRAQFLACTTDPLAETFFVSENVYPNGVFLTGVDLFFQSKDATLPVFVQLRPTNNGYPSSDTTLPLSTVWLNPSKVNVPTTLSGNPVATHFGFSDPVYLPAGQYAIVVGSNSTNYKAFTGTVGAKVLGTTGTISSQPNVGSLFESQNASTWTAQQSSDLCFVLYQAIFDTTTPHTAIFNSNAPDASFVYQLAEVISQELDFNNSTTVTYSMQNTNIDNIKDSSSASIIANQNVVLTSTKKNASSGDTTVSVSLSTKDKNVSPVLDTDRMSLIMVNNIVNNTSDVTIPETSPAGGNAAAKYVTRSVTLADGFDATGITVNLGLNSQAGSSIQVYVKVLSSEDADTLQNKNWQLVPNTSGLATYSQSYSDFTPQKYQLQNISYINNGVTYSKYRTFAVKVVMYSSNASYVPQIANFGAIATA